MIQQLIWKNKSKKGKLQSPQTMTTVSNVTLLTMRNGTIIYNNVTTTTTTTTTVILLFKPLIFNHRTVDACSVTNILLFHSIAIE